MYSVQELCSEVLQALSSCVKNGCLEVLRMTDKTQTKAVSNAPLTDGEFAEKYNRGHKIIDFVGPKRFSSEFLLQLLLSVSYVTLFLVHA